MSVQQPEGMNKRFRVAEVFGPTIQGEGRNVGMPCYFVRFGGCDYRCVWCDSPHAVLPDEVNQLKKCTEWEILHEFDHLEGMSPTWVVLSGGNPGLLNLNHLIDLLHTRKHKVMLETQGSVFREWFGKVDDLCFSPKPPSSGMKWDFKLFDEIIIRTIASQSQWAIAEERKEFLLPYLKVPVFTDEDLEFAANVKFCWPNLELFLSIGNDDPYLPTVGNPRPGVRAEGNQPIAAEIVLENQREWTEKVLTDQRFDGVRIFSQQHVLLWGNERGR